MAENGEGNADQYAKDGSVDLRGNPVLRSRRGGWTACSFIVVYEVFERMAYYGISSNLVIYLTNRLHEGTVEASNNVTNWVGTVFLTPVIGAYIADAFLGRYWTFLIASAVYLSVYTYTHICKFGMCLLTLAVSVSPLRPADCKENCEPASTLQLSVFFGGLYIIALANGGTKPNISTIGADQFDEFDSKERMHKLSFFNWWTFSIFTGTLFANTFLVYIQDNVGWTLGYAIPTLGLMISIIIFLVGTPYYRHRVPQGSPFTRMTRVIVAAIRKWKVPVPNDPKELHELDLEVYAKRGNFRVDSTNSLRFLNKAAVKDSPGTPSMVCPVTQVEETKQILRLLPLLLAMFIPCAVIAQTNTLFVKQGTTLNRHIGPQFQIPPASLGAFVTISMLLCVILYDRFLVKVMRAWTKNPRGITLLKRMGVGLVLQIVTMSIASLTERRRLSIARSHGLDKAAGQVPVTIFMLLPQFVLMGLADAFMVVGIIEFFYDQAPESMKSLGTSYSLTAYGVGNFLSSFLLKLVAKITSSRGKGWILNNLNASHLDYYYAFLTLLSVLNFIYFLYVSNVYSYKSERWEEKVALDDQKAENG
ncbi:protein NRT1/ PTR FAMILY 5.2-like isoform X2 [Zingiber officinale]|uniref:protein NRT1/ PTR FAMILY 5.2-like isoform X2 n=1 Tax=Zingiber officinale TaxID=94328 RepID=UPI001C4B7751|nr:protein NRT1/ PTR FAMILY 5.2-like isoform X2 [Zingiber officinale]